MRLLIIRHGDPDYDHDSLTEKGWREADYLAERLARDDLTAIYVSPLGRAKATASRTLEKRNQSATECAWLREFVAPIRKPNLPDEESIPWDWLPQDWTVEDRYYQPDAWYTTPVMQAGQVRQAYDWVTSNLDALLQRHGYIRKGRFYRAERSNTDTVALFCHFGVECVLLSHLLHLSPMPLWHGTCAAPSSVTTLYTEERREGIAAFRMAAFGDVSHLYAHQEPPAFAARFREAYANTDQRAD